MALSPSPNRQTSLRPADERGRVRIDWLDSRHTFSFGSYYDPAHMGFGPLRVLNDDRVAPGGGFPPHGHRDMEIVSYVVEGSLAHRDSTGSGGVLNAGQVQVMSAGHGIRHSEFNARPDEALRFLQIWIEPSERRRPPRYDDRDFGHEPGVTLVVSPDGREGSLSIGQDADVYRVLLDAPNEVRVPVTRRRAWVQIANGQAEVAGTRLGPGDGLALEGFDAIPFTTEEGVEALVLDLPA